MIGMETHVILMEVVVDVAGLYYGFSRKLKLRLTVKDWSRFIEASKIIVE